MRLRIASRADAIVTTLALPRDLHRRLVLAAIDENAAAAECIRRAIREWLDRRAQPKRRGRTSR